MPQEVLSPYDVPERWPVHRSEDVWRGSAPFAVRRDEVSRPGSPERFGRLVVEHPGAVVVLALDEQERVLVLRQYRHPAGIRFVELPAGLLDIPGEPPVDAARRELREEAHLVAEEWTELAVLHPSPGISAERIDIFLARGLAEVGPPEGYLAEHEEADMTRHWLPLAELREGVLDRTVTDGPLALAVMTYTVASAEGRL